MLDFILEELHHRLGKKCIIIVGTAQFRVMENMLELTDSVDTGTRFYDGHEIFVLNQKSYLRVVAVGE